MAAQLIYDADCGFCTQSARWIEARWRDGPAARVASRDLSEEQLAEYGLTRSNVNAEVQWIAESGEAFSGARAIARALAATSGWTRLVGRAISAPPASWVAPFLYRIIAANRRHFPGGTEACTNDRQHP